MTAEDLEMLLGDVTVIKLLFLPQISLTPSGDTQVCPGCECGQFADTVDA